MISHGQTKGLTVKDKLNIAEFKKFGASTVEEYTNKITKMNLNSLAEHAILFDIVANVDRKKMERLLITSYKKAKAKYEAAHDDSAVKATEISLEKKQRVLDRLAFIK